MSCKSGLTQYSVEAIIKSLILNMLNDGTLQAGLKGCDTACDTYLGKGVEVVTCSTFSDTLCKAIEEDNTCLPFIDTFLLNGTVLTLTAGDRTFEVDLAGLLAELTASEVTAVGFTTPTSTTLRVTLSDSTKFDVDLSRLVTPATDVNAVIAADPTTRTTIAGIFNDCAGVAQKVGAKIPTCKEMNTAIAAAKVDVAATISSAADAKTAVAGVFVNCAGNAHAAGDAIPTCDEMTTAITDALSSISLVTTTRQGFTGETVTIPQPLFNKLNTPVLVPLAQTSAYDSAYTRNADGTLTFAAKDMLVHIDISTGFVTTAGGRLFMQVAALDKDARAGVGFAAAGGDTMLTFPPTSQVSNRLSIGGHMGGFSAALASGTVALASGTMTIRVTASMTVAQRTFGVYVLPQVWGLGNGASVAGTFGYSSNGSSSITVSTIS